MNLSLIQEFFNYLYQSYVNFIELNPFLSVLLLSTYFFLIIKLCIHELNVIKKAIEDEDF